MALESYITSVQNIEITISDGNSSNSANLAAGTVIGNCIPFVSMKIEDMEDDWDSIMCDVYFTAGSPPTITLERNGSTGNIYASVFIIEFDGSNVVVQQGTFSMSSAETTDQQAISEITATKAFAKAFHMMGGTGDDDWDHSMVKCWFSDTTHIDFERDQATGEISGHWYLAEAQGTEFTTQAIDITLASGTAQDSQVISSVTTTKTMIVASFESTGGADYIEYSATRVWLEDATHVYAERFNGIIFTVYVKGWVVEFSGSSNISVQRGSFSYDPADTSKTTDITAVTQANSIINNPTYYGLMECDGSSSANVEGGWQKLTFVDADTIQGVRDDGEYAGTAEEAISSWEVIDFTASAGAGDIDEVNTVDWANVDEIMGVSKASIDEINGVSST